MNVVVVVFELNTFVSGQTYCTTLSVFGEINVQSTSRCADFNGEMLSFVKESVKVFTMEISPTSYIPLWENAISYEEIYWN